LIGDDLINLVLARSISVNESEAGQPIAEAKNNQTNAEDILKGRTFMENGWV